MVLFVPPSGVVFGVPFLRIFFGAALLFLGFGLVPVGGGSEARKPAVLFQQFRGRSGLLYLTFGQDDDLVGVPDHRIAMGDDDDGGLMTDLVDGSANFLFRDVVKVGGGLVEHYDPGVGGKHAGNLDTLAFADGKPDAAFSNL